jgi:hypothetical protein
MHEFLNRDFLAGCLTGLFLIPPLTRALSSGRLDGWYDSRHKKPPIGHTVLACRPEDKSICAVTYNGPDGGGGIPEDYQLLWRPMPRPWS